MTATDATNAELPRWDVSDVHESFADRSFTDAMESVAAGAARLATLFDEHGIGRIEPREVTAADGTAADAVVAAFNTARADHELLDAYVYASVSTDSFDATAAGLMSELEAVNATLRPLLARLAAWVAALGVDDLAALSQAVAEHAGPLAKLAARAEHQMPDDHEALYAELAVTGSGAWGRLHSDVTSQLTAAVTMPGGAVETLPMAAVRGMASDADPLVRRAAYDAELAVWPTVAVACAAAINAIKGEAVTVNRRRNWRDPLDAALFANSVSRATFDAMNTAIDASLDDFRGWMRTKARLHGHDGALPWWDLVAPLPTSASAISWDDGLAIVRDAFISFGGPLGGLVDRAVGERWIDAGPRRGKEGGAFCMPFAGDRSLVFLNWNGSVDAAQTTAHELGHAYHNTQLAQRTPLQKMLPMALAETASIFCETLVVEEGLTRLDGRDRLALLDVDLQGANQVVVDIRSRYLFETELFAARQRRTVGVERLGELMLAAQAEAYGDGLDQSTAHPYMWAVKPHYYGSHFYNWPYTYGLLFGLGLFARYRDDPVAFRSRYDDVLSRCGMATAEELAGVFGFDVTDEAFWTASLDVLRGRIAEHRLLAEAEGLS
ncbi:MAG: M3 family oligoendopeptidase [Ilumatobacteraceae bacterium]